MTHTIEVSLPDELLKRIDAHVVSTRTDRSHAIQELVEIGLEHDTLPSADMTFAELLARVAGPSPANDMSDEELSEFVEAEVKAYREEKTRAAEHGG